MNEFSLYPVTFIIIGITVAVSLIAFNNNDVKNKALFYPYIMREPEEYYRFISHGLIHNNYMHLFFNMYTLYSFGQLAERDIFSKTEYVIFYITAIIASSIFDFLRNKNNAKYAALGASGAVSAVIFAVIILYPWTGKIFFMPPVLFGVVYLAYCAYMDKRGGDNIDHSAHLWGALYGIAFVAAAKPSLFKEFLEKLMHPTF